jgi:hypothetical protein
MAAALPVFAGISLLGTAAGAYGNIQAGNAQRDAAYQNADIAEQNAAQADISTADELRQLSRQTGIILGKQKAGFGYAGVKRSGTALDVLTETANLADRDAYKIQQQGFFQKRGFLQQASNLRYAGDVARTQSRITAGSTLLTGFGQLGLAGASRPS